MTFQAWINPEVQMLSIRNNLELSHKFQHRPECGVQHFMRQGGVLTAKYRPLQW